MAKATDNPDTKTKPETTVQTPTAEAQKPTVGSIIHFHPNGKDAELKNAVLPGIVVSTSGTMINLHVFPDTGHASIWRNQIPLEAETNVGAYWSWRAKS